MKRWLYRWDYGCWAHTLVQYAIIEKHWGKDWRIKLAAKKSARTR